MKFSFWRVQEFGGKVGDLNFGSVAKDEGMFQDILQLAYVSWKVKAHEKGDNIWMNPKDPLAVFEVQTVDEMIHEKRDVISPFPERGEGDSHHVQPVVQVLPEGSQLHHLA